MCFKFLVLADQVDCKFFCGCAALHCSVLEDVKASQSFSPLLLRAAPRVYWTLTYLAVKRRPYEQKTARDQPKLTTDGACSLLDQGAVYQIAHIVLDGVNTVKTVHIQLVLCVAAPAAVLVARGFGLPSFFRYFCSK